MRHLGSIGVSTMLQTSPDVRSDELVLASAVQRYVRREIDPLKTAVDSWGRQVTARQMWEKQEREDAIDSVREDVTRLDANVCETERRLRNELDTLQRNVATLAAVVASLHHDSLTSRWRRLVARVRGWWR